MANDDGTNARWVDPRYRALVVEFDDQVRKTYHGRGGTMCTECGGLRVRMFVHPDTKAPTTVPCLACNPENR